MRGDSARWPLAAEAISLPPSPGSVRLARDYVRVLLRRLGCEPLVEAAAVGVTELVTNVVLHARTPMTVGVRLSGRGEVRIEVADGSAVPPQPRAYGPTSGTGRGLLLLGSASTAWGVERAGPDDGKVVWFLPASDLAAGDSGRSGSGGTRK
ncbi:MAG TPA: ATP-binding protein [Mycobacteriales bacterium]|nr:ATP-binding protein [Mycobacteriales bacterium]